LRSIFLTSSVRKYEISMETGEASRLVPAEEEKPVEPWQWALPPICGLLVIFSVPVMTYGLYKPSLDHVLGLTLAQSQLIVSFGLVGSLILGFVPGIIYDKFGYVVTLCLGGAMATTGASLLYMFLKDGGAPGSPSWLWLAFSMMLMCHGSITQYFAGFGALMGVFPARLAGSMSAFVAILVSLGYILLPSLWSHGFIPAVDDTENYDADKRELKNLKPVANFFLTLAMFYGLITICGLGIAFKLPARKTVSEGGYKFAEDLQMLKKPATMALLTFAALPISFMYTFMTSGIAHASVEAGASVAERGTVLLKTGIIGMCGRFFHGFGADMLRSHTPAKQAGPHIASISAVSSTLVGFSLLMFSPQSWVIATYFIGFGFGGSFALFPASARLIFGAAEFGFGLGMVFFMVGVMNFVYGLLGAALEYGAWFYCIGAIGAAATLLMFTGMAIADWGQ